MGEWEVEPDVPGSLAVFNAGSDTGHELLDVAESKSRLQHVYIEHVSSTPRQASEPAFVQTVTQENQSGQQLLDAMSQQLRPQASAAHVPPESLSGSIQQPLAPSAKVPAPVKWPSAIAYMRAERVTYVPNSIDHTMLTWPMPSLPLAWQSNKDETGACKFTVLEAGVRPRLRLCSEEWTLHDIVTDAVASALQPVRAVQIIERPLHALPCPQIILTHANADPQALAVPLDFRRTHGWIITSHIHPVPTLDGMPALGPPGTPRPVHLDHQQGPLVALADSAGDRHVDISAPLDRYEWFTPVFGAPADGTDVLSRPVSTTSTTTTTTTTPFDQGLFRRPVLVPGVLEQAEILPTGVLTAPGAHIPIAELGLFQLVTRGSAGCTPFLLMVRGCEPVRLDGSRTWTLLDFCAAAASNAECTPRRLQVLTSPIPDLLQPQIVVTDRADDLESVLLPIDMRAAPGGVVLPVLLRHGMSVADVVEAIIAEIPDSRAFFAGASVGTDFFFQDAAGFVWSQLPGRLQAIQWLALRKGAPPIIRPAGVPTSTTTTTIAGPGWGDMHPKVCDWPPTPYVADLTLALPSPPLLAKTGGHFADRIDQVFAWDDPCHTKVSLIAVDASSKAPSGHEPVCIPPEGPPPNPDRDPRTPPGTARGPSSSRPNNADMIRAAQIRVLPDEVAEAAVYTAPVGRVPHRVPTQALSLSLMPDVITLLTGRMHRHLCRRLLPWQ